MGHHFRENAEGERVLFSDKYKVVKRSTGEEVDDILVLNVQKERVIPAALATAEAYAGHDSEYAEDIMDRLRELHPEAMKREDDQLRKMLMTGDPVDRARLIMKKALDEIHALGAEVISRTHADSAIRTIEGLEIL